MRRAAITSILFFAVGAALAQPSAGPGPVRFTEVVDHDVRQSVDLPGSVESRTTSVERGS